MPYSRDVDLRHRHQASFSSRAVSIPHLGSEVVDHAVDKLGDQMSDLTGKLRSHLPDFTRLDFGAIAKGSGTSTLNALAPMLPSPLTWSRSWNPRCLVSPTFFP